MYEQFHIKVFRFLKPAIYILENKLMIRERSQRDEFEDKIGLRFNEGQQKKTAFLTNFKTRTYIDMDEAQERMALLCYLQDENGEIFKAYYPFSPYFCVGFQEKAEHQVRAYIESKVPKILKIEVLQKIDLDQLNHLSGKKKKYLKISFRTVADLTNARKFVDLKKKSRKDDLYVNPKKKNIYAQSPNELLTDIREYDVQYHCRVCIDTGLRAGKWFEIQLFDKFIMCVKESEKKSIPDLKVLAFDIETSKDPFKFPEKQKDIVMMISIMFEGQAILIVNRDFCHQEVNNFQYDPEGKPEYRCEVRVFNVFSEKQTLQKFIDIIQAYRPTVITSFNGDRFDYPFIQARCSQNHIEFVKEMGVNLRSDEYFGSFVSHLDCYYWVDRDAFLPQGSRGLKAVTRAKLKYQPIEVDPEDMVEMGRNETQKLAEYAISDAVATFFLYMKHIHGFIYALSTIIPMMPDEVLRKGSGTLCEHLLMAEAFSRGIIFPNKQMEKFEKFYKGHLLDTETYTGGKVECLRSGIYRADFPTDFTLDPRAFQSLIDELDDLLAFAVQHQKSETLDNIVNYQQVVETLTASLSKFRHVSNPNKFETYPLIYHIDVAAMYPNIIITNRLQPVAVVNDRICSGCLFNSPENNCKRPLEWEWKGEYFPLNQGEYAFLKEKQELKEQPSKFSKIDEEKKLKAQVKKYCQKVYSKVHISTSQVRRDTVCMRENSFYVDTVRSFRDRRYEFKGLVKAHRARAAQFAKQGNPEKEKQDIKLMELYESMQLAHKIILNSFYGYVMRKGSRWYSMETAAMVTYIGSNIINDSKNYVEGRLGKPLELDTDGIWMLLPQGFPEDIKIKFKNGKQFSMSYPCQILNRLIYEKYANPQYQELKNQKTFEYSIRKEMTIAFQIDGPYKAMFIPGGKEKKKTQELDIQQHSTQMLKKRYVVFNFKNQVSEFKGLQMKRRGELNIIKMFQSEIFSQYVKGSTLKECYAHCGQVAMKYFDFILKKGQGMNLTDILERLEESKNLSKDLSAYGETKGVGITSARRLAEFLGPEVIRGKSSLCCYYIISAYPPKRTVTERAIPTQIFYADDELQKKYIYMWTKESRFRERVDIKDILDWGYYKQRLATQLQKMICIPAVMQNIPNPIPEIELPDWLQKKTFDMRFHRQEKIFQYGFTNAQHQNPQGKNPYNVEEEKQEKKSAKKVDKDIFQVKGQLLKKPTKNAHSLTKNFRLWLNQQKKIWRNYKREEAHIEALKYNELKSILQIVPDPKAGYFTIWYYSGGKIQSLFLEYQRHFYVKDKKGTKKAPREEGSAVQIILEEAQFLKNQDHYDSVLGKTFYETKVPLIINLLMKKGNLWKINKQLSVYKEQDIQEMFSSDYLPDIENNFMPFVYLSRLCILKSKYLFGVINPRMKEYTFIYVDNSGGITKSQLEILAKNNIKRKDARINIQWKISEKEACSEINKIFEGYGKSMRQPFLVLYQGDCPVDHIKSDGLHCLLDDYPTLLIPAVKPAEVSPLDWKKKTLGKMIEQSDNVTHKVVSLLEWSRFASIPICNLSYHQAAMLDFITNITFGRLLHTGDFVTWWNEYNEEIVPTYESKTNTGRIINSGLYSTFCVEINLDNLAVNTIANSEELMTEDREAAMMMQKTGRGNADKIEYLDEMTPAKKAFEYLKKMVKGWLKDLEIDWDKANDLLRNLHKWITTHSNAMFDPLLLRMVNELMKKIFNLLIHKLMDLGLHIIFANFSKIIVATDKHTYKQTESTIAYVLKKCLSEHEKLFGFLTLNTLSQYYEVLLYKDPFNFVGVLVNEESQQKFFEGELANNFYYVLQITNLFNPIAKEEFKNLVLHFVNSLWEIKKQLVQEYEDNKMKLMLEYKELISERMVKFIRTDFQVEVQEALVRANKAWESEQKRCKQLETHPLSSESQEEAEEDSFIEYSEEQKEIRARKKKNLNKEILFLDLEKWGDDKQLDMLVENIFMILDHDDCYRKDLLQVRKQTLLRLYEEPNISHRVIDPRYPTFQLPCSNCFLVNQQPGVCEHCREPINAKQELQSSIWKMMLEQGRDLYCSGCKRVMQSYFGRCSCGGRWRVTDKPLDWLPYLSRQDEGWNFINRVFDFMGLT